MQVIGQPQFLKLSTARQERSRDRLPTRASNQDFVPIKASPSTADLDKE